MRIELNVEGRSFNFKADYHTLYSADWNEIIRERLDEAYESERKETVTEDTKDDVDF